MVLTLVTLGSPLPVWRNYDEVFDLADDGGKLLAATNGGLLRDGAPIPSPAGLRAIESVRPLIVALADGRRLRREGSRWVAAVAASRPRDAAHGLVLDPGDAWPLGPPPPAHPYAALRLGSAVYAGTADGLYRLQSGAWVRQSLPGALPLARPNGIAEVGGTFVVGGLGGLFVGRPGAWKRVADDAIRQVATVGGAVWAVHGNGAVDKLEPAQDRLYPDLLAGSARRPWTSCVGAADASPLFGGLGGWTERGGAERYPPALKDDVVTALAARDGVRWIGSQKSGLFRFEGERLRLWNPGNGLQDPWVTALQRTPQGLVVGAARRGLFRLAGDRLAPLPSPTDRVASLAFWRGRLVVGGMDGAWIAQGAKWVSLPTGGEETTSLSVFGDRLAVTTAAGVYFFGSAGVRS